MCGENYWNKNLMEADFVNPILIRRELRKLKEYFEDMSSSLQAFDSLRPGSFWCRINFLRMLKESSAANTGVLVVMKARVAAMPTSAVAKCTGSVNANVCSETQPMEEMLEVIVSEPVTDNVNLSKDLVQPMLHV